MPREKAATGEKREKGRITEFENPDVLPPDEGMQRCWKYCEAQHGFVRVQVSEVPEAVHHSLVEVEVLGVDIKADDVRAAHAGQQH